MSLASCVIVSVIVVDVSPSNHDFKYHKCSTFERCNLGSYRIQRISKLRFQDIYMYSCTLAEDSVGHLHAPSLSHDLREGFLNLSSSVPIDHWHQHPICIERGEVSLSPVLRCAHLLLLRCQQNGAAPGGRFAPWTAQLQLFLQG